MPKSKSAVVDIVADSDEENLISLQHDLTNGHDKQNSNINEKVELKNCEDLTGSNKELYLIKLPKELINYQKKHKNLKLNLKDIKSGHRFKVQNIDYEAVITKSKVSFSCLCKDGDSVQAFQVNRCVEIPEIQPPEIVHKKIEVPSSIENYIEKRNSILNKKRSLKNEIIEIDSSIRKKIKKESSEKSHKNKKNKI